MKLGRGDLLPRLVVAPPGPNARRLSVDLARFEAPGINTLEGDKSNVVWAAARGANVLDVDGNRYLDLTAGFGVAAVGHRHPAVVAALRRQSGRLIHGLGDAMAHEVRIDLARRLAGLAPMADALTYFAVSGADAVEIALKTALLARPGRSKILAFEPSYHGLTLGALAASSRPAFRAPFAAHLHDQVVRAAFAKTLAPIAQQLQGGEIAAVLVEPVVGREGVLLPPPGWLAELAALARAHDSLIIFDEIFTGFGRLGATFACQQEGVVPDLLCCGKALGGGLPIAAVLGTRHLLKVWEHPGEARHTATFVAHPLACAAALAVLEILEAEQLVERAAAFGQILAERLATWPARFPQVQATRGRGLLWGIELEDRLAASAFVAAALQRGVMLLSGGPEGRVAQIAPPLTISARQLEVALDLLEASL
jgi:4-aminobutyrate aminotransferase-like enzyme